MPKQLTQFQIDIIYSANGKKDVKVLARETGMSEKAVHSFCYRRRIPIKKLRRGRGDREYNTVHVVPGARSAKRTIQRPPAVYSNHSPFGIAS